MHKLARIIYTMLKNQTEYRDPEEGYFEERACPEPFALGPQALVLYPWSYSPSPWSPVSLGHRTKGFGPGTIVLSYLQLSRLRSSKRHTEPHPADRSGCIRPNCSPAGHLLATAAPFWERKSLKWRFKPHV